MKIFASIAAVVLCAFVAFAQVWSPNTGPVPDDRYLPRVQTVFIFDTSISNETATISAANRVPLDVPVNSLAVFAVTLSAENPGTSNVVFGFNTSLDGVAWTTDEPYTVTVALSGTNVLRYSRALATNILGRYLSFDQVETPQTNAVAISTAQLIFLPKP